MSEIKAVLFDLDGTLLDTLTDLAESMNAVLIRLGLPVHPRAAYRYFVGDGMEALARRVLPEESRDQAMIERCSAAMAIEYQAHWADQSKPYEGIPELLNTLVEHGLKLAILSNKPDEFARLMVNHFLPGWPWSEVRGARPGTPKKPDPSGALAIAQALGLEPSQFLYLGDTNTDMRTARSCGMYPVGALWGFRTQAELAEAGAKSLLDHPRELMEVWRKLTLPVPPMPSPGVKFEELRQIIVTLRQPGGCPWDIKQTPESFKSYLIEETHELLEAIDRNDPALVKEELGDLLFQVLFISQMFEEQGRFTLSEVIAAIMAKMIERHPHVFGDEVVNSEAEQRRRWNEIKAREKEEPKSVADLLTNVPRSLPGLRRAQRVSERAAHNGFEWQDLKQALAKLTEEIGELNQAVASGDPEQIAEELGDSLFMLVNLGRLTKTNSEEALQATTDKFISRLTLLEHKARATGRAIAELTFSEQLALWNEVKNDLTAKP